MELNNNLYVAFSFNHLKFSKIVHDTYMTIYVYNKDDGSFQVMYDVTYDQLKRANQVKNVDGKPISLIAYRYGSGMFHPEHNSIIWDNISYILKAIDNIIIYGKYNILGKDDVRIESQDLHVKYLGENPTVISNHRSLLLSMIDKVYVYETYLIGFNVYMLHDLYRMYETIPHVTDLDNNKTEHLREFVTYALDNIPCFENQSLGNIHECIWNSYISKVNGSRGTLDFWKTYYDNNPTDTTLSQKIVIGRYDDDEGTFHKNVDDLVDEVNIEYSAMKKRALALGDTTVTHKGVTKTADVAITVNNYVVDVESLSVGDELTITHDVYGDVPFIVIGTDHDAPDTITILSKEIIELLPFDAKEPNNSDTNRQDYGNNRYLYSNLLQWMNSEADAGQWYTAKHSADASPTSDNVWDNPYADKAGFLHGFSEDFKRQLVTVNKTTAKNTVTDGGGSETVSSKVFLLSTTEVGLANENNIAEGTIYEYFSKNNTNARRIAYPSTYCLNNAGEFTSTNFAKGKGWHYWLRTPDSSYSCGGRIVSTSGTLNSCDAYGGIIGLRVGLTIANQ